MDTVSGLRVQNVEDVAARTHNSVTARTFFDARHGSFLSSFSYFWATSIEAGEANAPHVHEDIEKVYYVLAGEARVTCGEDMATVRVGDSFFFPVAVQHSITNTGSKQLHMLVYASRVIG